VKEKFLNKGEMMFKKRKKCVFERDFFLIIIKYICEDIIVILTD
jgi:hypothetical protein